MLHPRTLEAGLQRAWEESRPGPPESSIQGSHRGQPDHTRGCSQMGKRICLPPPQVYGDLLLPTWKYLASSKTGLSFVNPLNSFQDIVHAWGNLATAHSQGTSSVPVAVCNLTAQPPSFRLTFLGSGGCFASSHLAASGCRCALGCQRPAAHGSRCSRPPGCSAI